MNITTMSKSAYEKHEECPLKYFISYILKHKEPSIWKATPKGTIVHLALEILAQISIAEKKGQSVVQTDVGEIDVKSHDVIQIVTAAYNKIAIDDDYIQWDRDEDLGDCIAWTLKTLNYNGGEYDPRKLKVIDIEKDFKVEITKPWAMYDYIDIITGENKSGFFSINGVIDLVTEIGPNLYHIIDWKSGKRKDWATGKNKEYESFVKDIQLQLYYWAARELYPGKDILVTIFYINAGGPFTVPFDESNIDEIELKIMRKYLDITHTNIPRANHSFKCKWCHYSKVTSEEVGGPKIIEMRDGKHSKIGDCMSLCNATEYALGLRSEEAVIKNMRNFKV